MNSKKKLLKNFRLYAITDLKSEDSSITKKVDAALRGGVDIIQLRSKTLLDAPFLRIAQKFVPIVRRHRKLFFINDRVHLMLLTDADGIHLGQDDLSIAYARKILGSKRLIGRSTHSLEQAVRAEREGHDYIGVGPVFETPTKPNYSPVGLKLIEQVSKRVRIPFVAIGGIDATNVARVIDAGACRVAVVRAVFAAKDVRKAAEVLLEQLK
ncbi:MAG: thiamine phosphate synthase [Candidatus Omnitrophica bacterium]|nr:thiamine phosphate synthase [Candidatus Omnitrophota bacterium]